MISVFEEHDSHIWIPVARETEKQGPRAFLPSKGLKGTYTFGYKAEPEQADYLHALREIQYAYIHSQEDTFYVKRGKKKQRQKRAKWRHPGQNNPPLLGPTKGWVRIPVAQLKSISEQNLAQAIDEAPDMHVDLEEIIPFNSDAKAETNRISSESSVTMAQSVIEARRGQGLFRDKLLEHWSGECAVTEVGLDSVLRASHIKPWRVASDEERLDVYNGLLLNPTLDALFDEGLISFTNQGRLICSDSLREHAEQLGIFTEMKLKHIDEGHIPYLEWHRAHIFIMPEREAND